MKTGDDQDLDRVITASNLPDAAIDKARSGSMGSIDLDPLGSRSHVNAWFAKEEKAARGTDDAARLARARLQTVADKATNEDVKKRAAKVLTTLPVPRKDSAR